MSESRFESQIARLERGLRYARLLAEGLTMDQIGAREDISRQRVHQILRSCGVEDMRAARRAMNEEQRESLKRDRDLAELLYRCASARPCVLCGAWVLRSESRRTCSVKCAEAYRTSSARYRFDDEAYERHRMTQARSILKHREKHKPSSVAWAERMMSDSPPPPNRRYTVPGSRASQIVAEMEASA